MIPPRSKAGLLLDYFRSGWAFLLPYLLVYLLYAGFKWPVNPADGVVEVGSSSLRSEAGHRMPSLLHVYWLLHAIHFALAMVALRFWWGRSTAHRSSLAVLWPLIPWLGLALLFWIPGVYMEFPADPWQHYARVNEWSWHELVTQHSQWKKSSYFLAYSFIGQISPALLQLKGFDVYYTGCCLLLCWQYYRLARVVGLGERAALLFVLLNTLTFGNNIFSFYRYYGMSSTVFAQLGAVALTRIAMEALCVANVRPRTTDQGLRTSDCGPRSTSLSKGSLLRLGACGLGLCTLTAFNHVQGIGIAAIGIAAVVVWRLVAWKRSMLLWLTMAAIILSVATVWWYPRHPFLDSMYRPHGWLNAWYGFPLFQPGTPGFDRAWVIIGAFGGLNLLAGLWLVLRNRIEGWLTLMPALLLSSPFVAIPFASLLAYSTEAIESGYVMVYHRMLFAIPCGLAICALMGETLDCMDGYVLETNICQPTSQRGPIFALITGSFALLTLVTPGEPVFNRLFNRLMLPANDLAMHGHIGIFSKLKANLTDGVTLSTSQSLSYVAAAVGIQNTWYPIKVMHRPPSDTLTWGLWEFRESSKRGESAIAFLPPPASAYTSLSFSAILSGHWNPHQVDLQSLQGPAAIAWMQVSKAKASPAPNGGTYYTVPSALPRTQSVSQ